MTAFIRGRREMVLRPVTTPDVEVATIQLSIGGEIVTTKEGVSLYDVILRMGKINADPDGIILIYRTRREEI